jgi:hypothetical protein
LGKIRLRLQFASGKQMVTFRAKSAAVALTSVLFAAWVGVGQTARSSDEEFGPVVRAYLGYLRSEQEVVDDRVSRREISAGYYRRNSNRIKALRQMAIRLARDSHNDYLPELEAVASDEFGLLFARPPQPGTLKAGEVVRGTFRFLGTVRSGELFYVFSRLDPYEQAEAGDKASGAKKAEAVPTADPGAKSLSRTRRVVPQPSPSPLPR